MRVLPILFNTEMVRAILDGRKTVTRRVWKDWNKYAVPDMSLYDADKRTYAVHIYEDTEHTRPVSMIERSCPFCPGDILYVRETWEHFECRYCEGDEHGNCPKEPQKSVLDKYGDGCYMYRATDEMYGDAKWHPSIHMPKEAARIWLKVVDVRVERLQEITLRQIEQEGVDTEYPHTLNGEEKIYAFQNLWDSTIRKSDLNTYGWDVNPYVWVIEFERCERPEKK